jgi:hypothetical protein
MLADDVIRPISEEPLGAGIPTQNLPIGRDQENGVLPGVGCQQIESFAEFLVRKRIVFVVLYHADPTFLNRD